MTLRLDEAHGGVWRNDEFIELTPYQYRLLVVLLRAEGGFVSIEAVCESTSTTKDALHHQVMRLREKLGEPTMVFTKRGWGYRIERDA